MKRRNFIALTGTAALTVPLIGTNWLTANAATAKANELVFPELPYAYNALEPYIDAQTMELHYDKHHRGYFSKFITAIEDTKLAKMSLEDIFSNVSQYDTGIRNNGGGFYNHCLFWENMTPHKTSPSTALEAAIVAHFGSFEAFKEAFANAGKKQFGSGWAWLIKTSDGKLVVTSTPNQDNPLMDVTKQTGVPLLALDVWEHAYYLHYQNRRAEYVDNFWNLVNWDEVSRRFEKV
ncbi:MAG: superoxide dismutase [Mangrovibacterium sp.]